MKTVFIASGGTGGHIFPGLLLAKRLKKRFKVYFVGNRAGMEYDVVKKYGYDFLHIPSHGFVGKTIPEKLKSLFDNVIAFVKSMFYLKKFKPVFVIGTGSFTELPVGFSAKLSGRPLYITEQDSFPGVATRLLSVFADVVFLSYGNSKDFLRRKDNISVVGTITEVADVERTKEEIRKQWGIPDKMKVLFVLGGSRGARALNIAVIEMIKMGLPDDIYIVWQTGKSNFSDAKNAVKGYNFNGSIKDFLYNISEVYTISDLVIARAGACTLAELSDYGKASVLIPFPYAAHNHQMKNAMYYEKMDAAIVIEEKKLDPKILKKNIISLIYNEKKLIKMGENSRKLHEPGAADRVIKTILKRG